MRDRLAGIEEIERFSGAICINWRLPEAGVGHNAVPKMAAAAMTVQRRLKNKLRKLTDQDALRIYQAAL